MYFLCEQMRWFRPQIDKIVIVAGIQLMVSDLFLKFFFNVKNRQNYFSEEHYWEKFRKIRTKEDDVHLEKFSWCNFCAISDPFPLENFRKKRILFYEDLEEFHLQKVMVGSMGISLVLDSIYDTWSKDGFSVVKIDRACAIGRFEIRIDSIGESWLWTDIAREICAKDCVNVRDQKSIRDFFVLICRESASGFRFKMKLLFLFWKDIFSEKILSTKYLGC